MNYFYARVSTVAQNEARQLDAAKRAGIAESRIFLDKESGKDFDRTNWKRLVKKLKRGDVLFVKSIDRIGRNYKEIIRVWQELTKDREIDVVVLDMPLLDTRKEKNLLGTFVADIVLQILSFVAENERVNILDRQRQGIDAAKARGVRFGRPKKSHPEGFEKIARQYLNGEITGEQGAKALGMTQTTFCAHARKLGPKTGRIYSRGAGRPPFSLPPNFSEVADAWFDGKISAETAGRLTGMHKNTFTAHAYREFPDRTLRRRHGPEPKKKTQRKPRNVVLTPKFKEAARLWLNYELPLDAAAYRAGVHPLTFQTLTLQFKKKILAKGTQ